MSFIVLSIWSFAHFSTHYDSMKPSQHTHKHLKDVYSQDICVGVPLLSFFRIQEYNDRAQ